jgi:hypothetical protein
LGMKLFAKTPQQGAQAQLYLASAPINIISNHNGEFFWDPNMPLGDWLTYIKPQAIDLTLARELYIRTNDMIASVV